MISQLWEDVKYHVPTGLFFLFLCPYDFSTEPLYGGAEGKRKKTHIDSLGFSSDRIYVR